MAKNRVIYQSDALFVSKAVDSTGFGAHAQLRRVQSANYSFNISRQDVNQFGQLARLEAVILESPTVSFDTSYYLGDGFNEQALGFSNSATDSVGFIKGQIEAGNTGQNFYILSSPDGLDIVGDTSSTSKLSTIGVGNAFLTDYSLEASVGSFPTVSCSFEGTNMNATSDLQGHAGGGYTAISGVGIDAEAGTVITDFNNAVGVHLPQAVSGDGPSALRPGDITFSLANASNDTIAILDSAGAAHVQSVSLSIPLSRTPIDRLGSKFSFARVVDFPITPSLSVSAIVSDTQERHLTKIIDDDGFISELSVTFKNSDVSNTQQAKYTLKNVKLDSESFSSSIGPNKTVDLTFSLSVGGPNDTTNNVFFSGANAISPFDVTAPVITLVGDNPFALANGVTYVDPGVTVSGASVSAVVTDSTAVDKDTNGTYIVTYNVEDGAGNAATQVTRTVNVS